MRNEKHQIVIVGGGAGGMSVASGLLKQHSSLDIAIVEPSEYHYYQPAWTLVGGGAYDVQDTRQKQADHIPKNAQWIQKKAASFEPDNNTVILDDGSRLEYDQLLVAAGIQLDWHKVEGLEDTLGKNGVTSNYSYTYAPYTWECVQHFDGGRALFTYPNTPIKCAGAPQKILYLAADDFRKRGVHADLHYCTAGGAIFGVPFYAKALDKVLEAYHGRLNTGHNLVAVDGPGKKATFEVGEDKQRVEMDFNMIHVTPPQSAPDFIKHSPLANDAGWVAVDKNTLQHDRYANVFSLGDCCSAPNSKTAAAVRSQARVIIDNLLDVVNGKPARASYDGYASCPLTTSKGKMLLAEFAYDGAITPSFPIVDPRKPRRFNWWLKTSYLPHLYWNMIDGHLGPDWHKQRSYSDELPKIVP